MSGRDDLMAAPDSPLARARARYQQNQQADYLHLDVPRWGDDLVMRIGLPSDDGADGAVRTLMGLAANELKASPEEMADALASAVVGLYWRTPGSATKESPDGELEPLTQIGTDLPLRFDSQFGAAIGVPDCNTPRAAVMLAFTSGDPPALNTAALRMTVAAVGGWLTGVTDQAETSVSGS